MSALKALCFALVLLLAGCATQPAAERGAPALLPGDESPASWWYVRFRLRRPQGAEPLWYPDLLLADRVLGPVLQAEGEAIPLWRSEGGHALLHHLSAVFGYQELLVTRREPMRL